MDIRSSTGERDREINSIAMTMRMMSRRIAAALLYLQVHGGRERRANTARADNADDGGLTKVYIEPVTASLMARGAT